MRKIIRLYVSLLNRRCIIFRTGKSAGFFFTGRQLESRTIIEPLNLRTALGMANIWTEIYISN